MYRVFRVTSSSPRCWHWHWPSGTSWNSAVRRHRTSFA